MLTGKKRRVCVEVMRQRSRPLFGGCIVSSGSDSTLRWRTATRCEGGTCVEVAILRGVIMVRDSTRPETMLSTGYAEWRDFVAKVKHGTFDRE